jgi:hypothetical protein
METKIWTLLEMLPHTLLVFLKKEVVQPSPVTAYGVYMGKEKT